MKKLIKLSIVIAFSIIANFAVAQKSPEEKTKIIVENWDKFGAPVYISSNLIVLERK